MPIIILLVVICAVLGGLLAKSKHRDPIIWGLICGFFPLIGLIVLACVGSAEPIGGSTTTALIGSTPKFDEKKWAVLTEVDADIRDAVAKVAAHGDRWVSVLADKYLSVNDKSYLEAITNGVIAEAQAAPPEPLKGTIGPSEFARKPDGSYVIIGGAFVGQKFKNYDLMVAAYAKTGGRVIKVG